MRHPLSLEAFLDWVKKHDPKEEYDYSDSYNCAVGQYLRFLGNRFPQPTTDARELDDVACGLDPCGRALLPFNYPPRTFGGLAKNIEHILAQTNEPA